MSERAQACCGVGFCVGAEGIWDLAAADTTLTRLDGKKWVSNTDFDPGSEQTQFGNHSYGLWVVSV
ncbi:MAG: hypothetical protein ACTHW3_11010 [Leucobacter sp.]